MLRATYPVGLLSSGLPPPPVISNVFRALLYNGIPTTNVTTGINTTSGKSLIITKAWGGSSGNDATHIFTDTNRVNHGRRLFSFAPSAEDTSSFTTPTTTGFTDNGGATGGRSQAHSGATGTYGGLMFSSAPRFFDIVSYVGNGAASRSVPHGLAVPPGLIFAKARNSSQSWYVYWRPAGASHHIWSTGAGWTASSVIWGGVEPTANSFSVGFSSSNGPNINLEPHIAYLFADDHSANSVCRVISYNGNSATQNVHVGFQPQFVLIMYAQPSPFDSLARMAYYFVDSSTMRSADLDGSNHGGNASHLSFNATGFTLNSSFSNISGRSYYALAIRAP